MGNLHVVKFLNRIQMYKARKVSKGNVYRIFIQSLFRSLCLKIFLGSALCFLGHCSTKDGFGDLERAACVSSKMYSKLPKGLISLTYDDGPGPGTLKLAKYLYEQHICATFFVVGNSVAGGGYKNYPYLDSLIFYGQRIGSHTYNHKDLRTLPCDEVQYQVKTNQARIDPVIKNNLCYFTPPWFGWSEKVAKCILNDPSLNHIRGPIGMDFDTHDYLYRNNTQPKLCAYNFLNDPVNQDRFNSLEGGVIKMHDFNSYATPDFAFQETKLIVEDLKSRGYIFVSPTLEFSPTIFNFEKPGDFSDNKYWSSHISYYGTIRLSDVNNDHMADIVARKSDGMYVALSNGFGFDGLQLWTPEFSNSSGWKSGNFSPTLNVADVNGDGKSDIVIRSVEGIRVALSTGTSFQSSAIWTDQFLDASQSYSNDVFSSMRVADVNGDKKADLVAKKQDGIYVSLSSGTSFQSPLLWTHQFSNLKFNGWEPSKYNIMQMGDVNGDGADDIVEESQNSIMVGLSTGSGFAAATVWGTGFSERSLLKNNIVRLGDVNGDALSDLIYKGKDGIHVLLSTGSAFIQNALWGRTGFSEELILNQPCYTISFQFGDINGDKRIDFIFRNPKGISGALAP